MSGFLQIDVYSRQRPTLLVRTSVGGGGGGGASFLSALSDVSFTGEAQGDIFYRGATTWNNLPAGIAGFVLTTGGAGANPSWTQLAHSSLSGLTTGDPHTQYIYQTPNSSTRNVIQATANNIKPFIIKGLASQTANLQEWQDSTGAALVILTKDGAINASGTLRSTGNTPSSFTGKGIEFYYNQSSDYGVALAYDRTGGSYKPFLFLGSDIRFLANPSETEWMRIQSSGIGIAQASPTARLHVKSDATTDKILILQAIASQTGQVIQIQGQSSTTAGREQAEIDTTWATSTDATRKARLIIRVYDTSARTVFTTESQGSYAITEFFGLLKSPNLAVNGDVGSNVASGGHLVQMNASGSQTPLMISGGAACVQVWKDTTPSKAVSFGMAVPGNAAGDDWFFGGYNGSAWSQLLKVTQAGSVVCGPSSVATNATDGFVYIPGGAGPPTGTPTAQGSRVPLYADTTNNKAYIYSGGAWVALN